MAYQRFIVNGKKMAKKKKSKRTSSRRGTKASRSTAAKKAARTRATKKASRSAAAKKGARTRAKKSPKRRNPAKKAAKKVTKKRNVKKTAKKKATKRNLSPGKHLTEAKRQLEIAKQEKRAGNTRSAERSAEAAVTHALSAYFASWTSKATKAKAYRLFKEASLLQAPVKRPSGGYPEPAAMKKLSVTKQRAWLRWSQDSKLRERNPAKKATKKVAKKRNVKKAAKKTGIPESMEESLGSSKPKRRKPVAGLSKGRAAIGGARTVAGYQKAQEAAFKEMAAAEKACDSALAKTNKELAITKTELDKVKSRLKKAESAIKAFERTIGRLEAPAKAQAKKSLARLKTRQRETARIVKRTIQYYNTLNKKGQRIKRVRTGGKTWIKSPKTRAKRCPPSKASVKRSARAVRAGKGTAGETAGKAMADKRGCAGVKRNFWNMNEDLL